MTKLMIAALAIAAGLSHGQGKLKLSSKQLTPGGTVELTGTEFAKKEPFAVLLIGAAGRTELGEVHSDSAGKFVATMTVPDTVKPGSYRLVLEASDDDEAASAAVQVVAGQVVASAETVGHQHDETPSALPLELDRARRPVVTGSVVASIILLLAVGGVLLRRNGQG